MNIKHLLIGLSIVSLLLSSCKKDEDDDTPLPGFQLTEVKAGQVTLKADQITQNVPIDQSFTLKFTVDIDLGSARSSIVLKKNGTKVDCEIIHGEVETIIIVTPEELLEVMTNYSLDVSSSLEGTKGEPFPGVSFAFTTLQGSLLIDQILINGQQFSSQPILRNIPFDDVQVEITFSHALDPVNIASHFSFSGNAGLNCVLSDGNRKVTLTNQQAFPYYTRCFFNISNQLSSENGYTFSGLSRTFYTGLDSSYKFPLISDDALLDLIQEYTFKYFYDFAQLSSGMAKERNTSGNLVTTGGSGFGVMALIVGMERGFISRNQGMTQLGKILTFLETCDRFHGAWPHWLDGNTGNTIPFSTKDDGGDLVETAFMVQGLMTMRQYLDTLAPSELLLRNRINNLVNTVEWDWYTRGQNVLYWHWSPNYAWQMNMPIQGYNETMIAYVLAAASPTHTIPAAAYQLGYAKNGAIANGNSYYGFQLPLGGALGGPLFFTHYSFLGLDPRNLQDAYANYWTQNVNHSRINHAYCADNPKNWLGYGENSWGLTASDNPWGYNAHSPTNDLGVISPTAALSSLPYTPLQSMNAIRHFYYILGDRLWGPYGFYDAFSANEGWWGNTYLAIDQGPIICMVENHRTGLLWDLFMSSPEVQQGLTKLGFSY